MFKVTTKTRQHLSAIVSMICFLVAFESSASQLDVACDHAVPMDLNNTWRGHGAAFESHIYQLEIPSAGLLDIEVATPTAARVAAKLELLGQHCRRADISGEAAILDRTATRSLVALRGAGTRYVRVAAQDPRSPLGDYRLSTSFATPEIVRGSPGWLKTEEVEVDPDPDGPCLDPGFEKGLTGWLKTEEVEVDPDPDGFGKSLASWLKTEEVEVDPDPDGFGKDLTNWLTRRVAAAGLCNRDEGDDHSDTLACATPVQLGRRYSGEIDNDWSDDQDTFEIVLSRPTTVHIDVRSSATEIALALYDRWGQRLATELGGSGLVRWLLPGRYVLRIAGMDGAEGAYDVGFDRLEW